ncbi:glycoside hydrolase family 64 protein [Streptomyces wuyuanensis]|uniref:glycoside hydrolase family 64 protein n=1 Tax=Streptomyces wuyuanensis TaxID=1196353 RepID=UPI003431FFD7
MTFRTAPRRTRLRTTALATALISLPMAPAMTAANAYAAEAPAPAFTQKLDTAPNGKARFTFIPSDRDGVTLVDVHYTVKGAPEGRQSLRMQRQPDGSWVLEGPPAGSDFVYHYTFGDTRLVKDTGEFDRAGKPKDETPTDPGTPTDPPTGATFPLNLVNHSGRPDSEVYVTVVGQASPGHYSYLRPDGKLTPVDKADGVYRKGDRTFPKLSFPLSETTERLTVPAHLQGARVYVSFGNPMYMGVPNGDSGYQQPDLNNPSDPNKGTRFDFYEFTYEHGKVAFGGNTTQVDGFAIPLTAELKQDQRKYNRTVGITQPAAQVINGYKKQVGAAFKGLAANDRITAPRSSADFRAGGKYSTYFNKVVDESWNQWKKGFHIKPAAGIEFKGKVQSDGKLHFSKNNGAPSVLNKPSTADIVACDGALANSAMTQDAKDLGAHVCAAFNRGVALRTTDGGKTYNWSDPATYYPKGGTFNDYAAYFHKVNHDHLAYGFAYDDVHDQSSVTILPNFDAPTSLTLTIGE